MSSNANSNNYGSVGPGGGTRVPFPKVPPGYPGDSGVPASAPPAQDPSPPPVNPGPAFDLVSSIKELQSLEEYLFSELQSVNLEMPQQQAQQTEIVTHINDLSDLRNDLFGQLGKIYVDLDKNSQVQRSALTDQIVTANMMEQQMNNLQNDIAIILAERKNKTRIVEIGEYEYLRYSAHKTAMQLVAFTSLAILFFSYSLKRKYCPLPFQNWDNDLNIYRRCVNCQSCLGYDYTRQPKLQPIQGTRYRY